MSTKSCANPRAAKNARAVLLLAAISGFAGCHGNRSWHSTATRAPNSSRNINACAISEEEEIGLSGDLSTDVDAAANYSGTVAEMLKAGKLEAIDCVADRAREGKERFPGGTWKLRELYKGVSAPVQHPVHATQEDWDILLKRLGEWVKARPRSITARVALASAYVGYAADIRGNGPANTVSEDGWKIFKERTTKAERILQGAATLPTKCPEQYLVMQKVAQNLSWSDAEKRDLFKRATNFEPGYFYYAQELAVNLSPKSGGKPGALEKWDPLESTCRHASLSIL